MNMCIPALYRISYRLVGRAYIGSLVTNDWHDGITRYRHPSRPASASRVHRRKPLSPLHTVVNVAIAAVGAVAVGALIAVELGAVVLAVALAAAIWLRGYLVPGTPELTKRYLPGARCGCSERDATPGRRRRSTPNRTSCRPRCWSRRRTGATSRSRRGSSRRGGRTSPRCATRPTPSSARRRRCRARRSEPPRPPRRYLPCLSRPTSPPSRGLAGVDERRARAAVARRSGIRARRQRANRSLGVPIGVPRGCRRRPRVNGASRRLGVAPLVSRSGVLGALRLFVERCPTCEGPVQLEERVVESCCSSYEVVAGRCTACTARLFELDLPPSLAEARVVRTRF